MKTNNNSILLTDIRAIRNVRLTNDGRHLVPSILTDGIQERPWVTPILDDSNAIVYYEIIRGHCRLDAAGIIDREYPEDFARLFKNGKVKVQVITEITPDEKEYLKLDFNRKNLDNPYEIQLAANLAFDAGKTEQEVVAMLLPMLGSLTGDRKKKVADLTAAMADANVVEKVELQRAIDKEVLEGKRGKIQGIKKIYDCPYIVLDCLYFKVTGKLPEHLDETAFLPTLTGGEISKLRTAFNNDLKAFAAGETSTPVTKMQPGNLFLELFESIVAEKRSKKEAKKEGPTKAMSRVDIVKPVAEGKLESSAMRDVINYHGADKELTAEVVTVADHLLAVVEAVKNDKPELWAECESVFDAYMKRQLAAQVAQSQRNGEEL